MNRRKKKKRRSNTSPQLIKAICQPGLRLDERKTRSDGGGLTLGYPYCFLTGSRREHPVDEDSNTKATDSWPDRAIAGTYRASRIRLPGGEDYVIDGMLPNTGASVWFGEGSVGKTQLLLWLAAHLAARGPDAPTHWLGREIRRRGQILVVSVEDLAEHLALRIDTILNGMKAERPGLDIEAIRERIHLLAYLSLDDDEFSGSDPSLYRRRADGKWKPSSTLKRIEDFIADWNAANPEDPIIGVILDSAVSISGFDLANTEATTSFLFRLNRESRRNGVFWAIIGHVVKTTRRDALDPETGAVSRLRGSAMWSTTPRTVVEVRFPMHEEDADALKSLVPSPGHREILYVTVVKANSRGADFGRRVLRRTEERYDDVTESFLVAAGSGSGPDDRVRAISALLRELTVGEGRLEIKRDDLAEAVRRRQKTEPLFSTLRLASGTRGPNAKSLPGILAILKERGEITYTTTGPVTIVDQVAE